MVQVSFFVKYVHLSYFSEQSLLYRYTGALLVSAGLLTQCIMGPIPEILEDCCCCGLGGCIGAILSSLLSKMILFALSMIIILCNFLGYFWIYIAKKSRTVENSSGPGSPNYCDTSIWLVAHVTIYTLFTILILLIVRMFASFYYNFILSENVKMNPIYINAKDPLKSKRFI